MESGQSYKRVQGKRLLRRVFCFARNVLALVGFLFIIKQVFFNLSVVVSGSMMPTLQGDGGPNSDWVLSEKVSYLFRKPKRWEVVWFHNPDGFLVAKRIVGLPGETISLEDFELFINGNKIQIPEELNFLKYYSYGNLSRGSKVNCGAAYYVLGDDSRDSADSRYDGTVAEEQLLGRAWLIIWPSDRLGLVNP